MNLRQLARDKPCMIRLPGICNRDPATTVLAHYRLISISGLGIKAPDILGAWACYDCHAVVDGQRTSDLTPEQRRLALAEGMARTIAQLWSMKVIRT